MEYTPEEQADIIQSLSPKELEAIFHNPNAITVGELFEKYDTEPKEYPLHEESLLVANEGVTPYGGPTIPEKIKLTGLTRTTILKVEQHREKATLEEILVYCNGLKINVKDFLSDLF